MPQKIKTTLIRALLWSQTYTKTDMVYLASGGFWLVLGQVVSSLSALALAVAFANLIPPTTYGTYKYILSLAGLFAIFSLPGMTTAFVHATAQGKDPTIRAATRSRVMHASVGSIFALIGSAYYFLNGNTQLSLSLLIIAATLPLFDTFTSYLFYFVGKRRFDLRTKYYAGTQVASTLVLIATILVTENLLLLLTAYFVPLLIIRAALYHRTVQSIPRTATHEDEVEVIRYGKHLTVMQILSIAANEIDKILIWKFLGPAHVAVYTFALAIPEQIRGPLKGVGELAFPKFAAQTTEQIKSSLPALWRKLSLYALGVFIISILYALAAPFIFQLLFPQYMESVPYSQLFALAMITNVSSIPFAILSAQKKTSTQYVLSIIQPLTAIGFLVVLIPTYGVLGAIIALLLSRFIVFFMCLGSLFTLK